MYMKIVFAAKVDFFYLGNLQKIYKDLGCICVKKFTSLGGSTRHAVYRLKNLHHLQAVPLENKIREGKKLCFLPVAIFFSSSVVFYKVC